MEIVILEGIVACFILLIACVVGIANGPAGLVCLYEKEVQERVVEKRCLTFQNVENSII